MKWPRLRPHETRHGSKARRRLRLRSREPDRTVRGASLITARLLEAGQCVCMFGGVASYRGCNGGHAPLPSLPSRRRGRDVERMPGAIPCNITWLANRPNLYFYYTISLFIFLKKCGNDTKIVNGRAFRNSEIIAEFSGDHAIILIVIISSITGVGRYPPARRRSRRD